MFCRGAFPCNEMFCTLRYCFPPRDLLSTRTGFLEFRATRAVVLPRRFGRKPLFPVDFRIVIEISCSFANEMISSAALPTETCICVGIEIRAKASCILSSPARALSTEDLTSSGESPVVTVWNRVTFRIHGNSSQQIDAISGSEKSVHTRTWEKGPGRGDPVPRCY